MEIGFGRWTSRGYRIKSSRPKRHSSTYLSLSSLHSSNPFAAERDFRLPRNFANFRSRLAARPANKTRRGFEFSWCNRIRLERGELVRERTNDRRNSITALGESERDSQLFLHRLFTTHPPFHLKPSENPFFLFAEPPPIHPQPLSHWWIYGEVKRWGYWFQRIPFGNGMLQISLDSLNFISHNSSEKGCCWGCSKKFFSMILILQFRIFKGTMEFFLNPFVAIIVPGGCSERKIRISSGVILISNLLQC